jgi:hypothetical protein
MGRTANVHHVEFLVPLPKVIGCDFSGTVISTSELPDEEKEASAANDDRLRVGDKINTRSKINFSFLTEHSCFVNLSKALISLKLLDCLLSVSLCTRDCNLS